MTDANNFDEIERYLAGELSVEERKKFEAEMESNEQLQAEVNLHRDIADALNEKDIVELEESLKSIIKDKKSTDRIFINQRWLAIAASFLLLISIGVYYLISLDNSPTSKELYQSYLQLPTDLSSNTSFRSQDNTSDNSNPFESFFAAYQSQDFNAALSNLEQLTNQHPEIIAQSSSTFNYFKGVTLMQLNQLETASDAFKQVKTGNYTENSEWFLALCLLRLEGTSTNTETSLKEVVESKSPYSDEAQAILSELFE